MKHRLAGCIVLLLLIGTGCAGRPVVPQTTELCAAVQGVYGALQVEAAVQRHGIGTMQLDFSAPDTLAGLTMFCAGDGTTRLDYQGLTYTADALPAAALPQLLCAVLDDAARRSDAVRDGCLTGRAADAAYTLCFDETGRPVSLTIPSLGAALTFTIQTDPTSG